MRRLMRRHVAAHVQARSTVAGRANWSYCATLVIDEQVLNHDHVELCFDGSETFARILVNGTTLGQTRNMHRRYRLDAKSALRAGGNGLEVRFAASLPELWAADERQGPMPWAGGSTRPSPPHNSTRHMSCDTGWDWARPRPQVASGGQRGSKAGPAAGSATSARSWLRPPPSRRSLKSMTTSSGMASLTPRLIEPDADDTNWPVHGVSHGSGMKLRINRQDVYCKGAN
jgi:hypothetical protein